MQLPKNPQPASPLLLWWPVFMGVGIGFYTLLNRLMPFWAGLVALGCVGLISLATRRWRYEILWTWLMHISLAIVVGFTAMQIRTQTITISTLTYPEFNVRVSGIVEHAEYVRGGWRVMLRDATITKPEKYRDKEPREYRVRITLRGKNVRPVMGSRIATRASFIAPSPPLLPGMFNFQRHAFYEEISGYGYSNAPIDIIEKPADTVYPIEYYRQYLAKRIRGALLDTHYKPMGSVIGLTTALLNGQRAGMDKQSEEDMQHSGLQHLISISGVHVSMLAGIVFFFVRFLLALSMRMALTLPIKKIAAAVALVAIIFYMAVVGLTAPTVRSVLMTGLVLVAVMLDREAISLRLVAIAAIVILLVEPDSILTPGFQMSFAAVAGLVVFYQHTTGFWQHEFWRRTIIHRLLFVLAGGIATTMVATFATAPFALYHFQQLPVLSVIANLLVTPIMSLVIMPASLLAYMTLPWDFTAYYVMLYFGWGTEKILQIAHWVAQSDYAVWRLNGLSATAMMAMTFGLIWMLLQRHIRMAVWGLLLVVVAFATVPFAPQPVLALIPGNSRAVLYAPPDEDVLYYDGRVDKFTRDLLIQYLGKNSAVALPKDKPLPPDVYIARNIPELEKICDRPEKTIVSPWYIDARCKGKTIIDRNALKKAGQGIVVIEQ